MPGLVHPMLAVRTHFSLGESLLQPKDIKAAAKRVDEPRVVIVDNMTLSAVIQIAKASDATLEARYGVSLFIVDDISIQDKKVRQPSVNLKVYPHDEAAMQKLFELLSLAYEPGYFYERARLGWDDVLLCLSAGNFSVSTGDLNGLFEHPHHRKRMDQLDEAVGKDNLYIELVPVPTGYHDQMNAKGLYYVETWQLKPLVTIPTFYEGADSHGAWETNLGIAKRSTMKRPVMMRRTVYQNYQAKTEAEFMDMVRAAIIRQTKMGTSAAGKAFSDGIKNAAGFYDKLAYTWSKQPISLPSLAADPDHELKLLCVAGIRKRMANPVFGYTFDDATMRSVYMPRLKYELGVLKAMGFADYFLVVDDLVRWCKANGILVGPGRGSVGGSLVAYLMGITDVDPIRFGLIFERFINPSRRDLPDIDLDFMSTRRQEVIDYLVKRHGADKVAGISNYGVLASASAMKDVGRVFGLEVMQLTASSRVPSIHGKPVDLETAKKEVAEISRFADDHPTVWKHACKLQSTMRSYGKHASGIVVAGVPLTERAVVEKRQGERIINWDMRVAEDMGLVKLDILGLSTLDTIAKTLDYIRRERKPVPDLLAIPLDCKLTLKGFSEGKTIGVFQMEGGGARRILKDMSKVNPLDFNDIVAANALNRPGPIDAGLVQKYVDAKNGVAMNTLPHSNMEEALRETFNVIVYQEQVMKIAVDLCGFSLADADGLRKAMGKKDAKIMASYKDKFVNGALSHSGMVNVEAQELFEQIEVFAGYAFNKSHAAEYSLISYQAMWLKTHYPIEFYAASLSTVKDDKLKPILLDALKAGIEVLPPDINNSENDFVIANRNTLLAPFNRVKNVTEKSGTAIMAIRAEGKIKSIKDLQERLREKKWGKFCNSKSLANLDAVGSFAHIEPGQKSPMDDSRVKDKLLLMPGLVTQVLRTTKAIPIDKYTMTRLGAIVDAYTKVDTEAVHVRMCVGKNARFMVVTDAPTWSEEADQKFTAGRSFEYASEAMRQAGLKRNDAYWTGLLKRPKDDKMISPAEIKAYGPFLQQEVELLKPELIVCLGSNAARFFVPDLKGSIFDHVGKVVYLPKIEATVIIGLNPAMIHHDKAKMDDLVAVFKNAKEIITPIL